MRSFAGRDILSLKGFERAEFEHVFRGRRRARADRTQPEERRPAHRQDAADGLLPAEHAHAPRDRGRHAPARRARPRLLRREEHARRRLLPGVDQGHGAHAGVLRRRHRDAPLPAGRAGRGRQVVVGARDQLRRRLGRAPDPGADRPLHDPHRARHDRRPHVPARRRHADAHDALDPLRDVAVRHQGVRRRAAGHVAAAGVQGRARRAQRALRGGSLGRGRDPRLRRDLHGARRPARLHEVARRARRERRHDAGGVPGHPRAAARPGRSRGRSSSTACPAWTSCPRTSTGPATPGTGRRRSTAS